jgi:hypothetical protein
MGLCNISGSRRCSSSFSGLGDTMLESPYRYEEWFSPDQFRKLGELVLKWSHLDHVIGNCLGALLKLSPEESAILVFPLSTQDRLDKLKKLAPLHKINADAQAALDALTDVSVYVQQVRNNVVHAVIIDDPKDGILFHLRSKQRWLTIEQVFSTEELTNYASHCAMSLRYALGPKAGPVERHPLPDKPAIPGFFNCPNPKGIRVGQPLAPRLQSSPK